MTKFLDVLMTCVSTLGNIEFIIISVLLITLILVYKRNFIDAIWFNVLNYGGVVFNYILKVLFARERPSADRSIEAFNVSFELTSYSFPSGHTMRASLFFLSLLYILFKYFDFNPKIRSGVIIFFLTATLLVAYSRIYFNYHYISDAIGAVIASLCFFLAMNFTKKQYDQKIARNLS